jgi:hypothetical protein
MHGAVVRVMRLIDDRELMVVQHLMHGAAVRMYIYLMSGTWCMFGIDGAVVSVVCRCRITVMTGSWWLFSAPMGTATATL